MRWCAAWPSSGVRFGVRTPARELEAGGRRLQAAMRTLGALDPRSVLQRGYAIVRGSSGDIVKNALDLKVGERLDVELGRGHVQADVVRADALL